MAKRPDGTAELHVEHVKNGESGYTLEIRPERVTVELEDGPFDTIVAEITADATGAPVRKVKERKSRELSDDQKTALKAVARATLEKPVKHKPSADIPAHAAVTTEVAAIEMIARLVSCVTSKGKKRPPHAQREHAKRIFGSLHDRYLVRVVDGVCWLSKPDGDAS